MSRVELKFPQNTRAGSSCAQGRGPRRAAVAGAVLPRRGSGWHRVCLSGADFLQRRRFQRRGRALYAAATAGLPHGMGSHRRSASASRGRHSHAWKMGGVAAVDTGGPKLPLAHGSRWRDAAVWLATAFLEFPAQALQGSTGLDDSGATGTLDRAISLAQSPSHHPRAVPVADFSGRRGNCWAARRSPQAGRQCRAVLARGNSWAKNPHPPPWHLGLAFTTEASATESCARSAAGKSRKGSG